MTGDLELPTDRPRVYRHFMNDAQRDEAPTTTRGTAVPRRNPYVVVLLAVGGLATIGGLIWGLAAKASADHALLMASSLPTLPVHTFTQYTSHAIVLDYTGLWTGILVAILGVIILLAGVIVASTKRRVV